MAYLQQIAQCSFNGLEWGEWKEHFKVLFVSGVGPKSEGYMVSSHSDEISIRVYLFLMNLIFFPNTIFLI